MASQNYDILKEDEHSTVESSSSSSSFVKIPRDEIHYSGSIYTLSEYENILKTKIFNKSETTYNWEYDIRVPILDEENHHKCFAAFLKNTLLRILILKKYISSVTVEEDDVNTYGDSDHIASMRNYSMILDKSVAEQISNNWRHISETERRLFLHTMCIEDNLLQKTTFYFEVVLFDTLTQYAHNIVGRIEEKCPSLGRDVVNYEVKITGDFTFGWNEGSKLAIISGAVYNKKITNLLYYAIKNLLNNVFQYKQEES